MPLVINCLANVSGIYHDLEQFDRAKLKQHDLEQFDRAKLKQHDLVQFIYIMICNDFDLQHICSLLIRCSSNYRSQNLSDHIH